NKAGLFAGGYVNLEFGRRSAFQMELEYIQKGSRKNPDHSKDDYDSYLLRLGYVELPVLYQFKIKDWLSIETGPSIGFLFHYYEKVDEQEQEPNPDFCKVTYSWNIGINFIITDRILINFRSNNSLVNIRTDRVTGDVRRFWAYGEYNDIFILSVFCRLTKLGKDRSEN
ncbi:MAG: PorT family protein, partial [Bacteroidetes bacterium]|nr:PorT family protein [Bacteroidota bacterium]